MNSELIKQLEVDNKDYVVQLITNDIELDKPVYLENPDKFNFILKDSPPPISAAAFNAAIDSFEILLENGASVEALDGSNRSLFHFAAAGGSVQILQEVLDHGVDIRGHDNMEYEPVHYSVKFGRIDAIKWFWMNDVDATKLDFASLERVAILSNSKETLEYLFSNGVNVTADSLCVLKAVEAKSPSSLEFMIERGEGINDKDSNGWTPLFHAIKIGSVECALFLIRNGAEIKEPDQNGMLPIHWAAKYGVSDVVSSILDKDPAQINAISRYGWAPIHLAACYARDKTVEILLSANPDLTIRDSIGCSPMHMAAMNGQIEIMKAIHSAGGSFNDVDNEKWTLLHWAASNDHREACIFLLNNGLDLCAKNSDGDTALDLAVKYKNEETERELRSMTQNSKCSVQ